MKRSLFNSVADATIAVAHTMVLVMRETGGQVENVNEFAELRARYQHLLEQKAGELDLALSNIDLARAYLAAIRDLLIEEAREKSGL